MLFSPHFFFRLHCIFPCGHCPVPPDDDQINVFVVVDATFRAIRIAPTCDPHICGPINFCIRPCQVHRRRFVVGFTCHTLRTILLGRRLLLLLFLPCQPLGVPVPFIALHILLCFLVRSQRLFETVFAEVTFAKKIPEGFNRSIVAGRSCCAN